MLFYEKSQIKQIEQGDINYPKELSRLSDCPKTLYYIGDIRLLKTRLFTVVGSRRTPVQAIKLGTEIARDLSEEFTLLTGTADGGDGAAIEGALQGGGRIVCVLAGGFSAIPQGNLPLLEKVAKKGLLLALHEYDTPVRGFSYAYRNKVLAKLGEGTLVLGAPQKSGALITARYAWQYKKKLFALPYFPNASAGEGCNAILKAGGILTENAGDVYKAFGLEYKYNKERTAIPLNETEEKLYDLLKDLTEAHITELSDKTAVPTFKAKATLSALEVKGLVVHLGGNRYGAVK